MGFVPALLWVAILFVFTLQNHRSYVHDQLQQEALDLTHQVFLQLPSTSYNGSTKEFKWNNVMYDVVHIQKVRTVHI